MISRRDVVKLSAAGLLAPIVGSGVAPDRVMAQFASGDYPMGGGNPARNSKMPGPAPDLDKPITIKWTYYANNEGSFDWWVPPSIVNDTLYTGGRNTYLYALDTASGEERWRFNTVDKVRDAPVVNDGMVYATSWGTDIYALDAESGNEHWRYTRESGSEYGSWGGLVADGTLFFSSGSQVYAVSATSGEERWQFATDYVASRPAFADGSLFVNSTTHIHAVDASSGDERWRLTAGSAFLYSPVVVDDVVFTGSSEHQLHAADIQSGDELWRFSPDPPSPEPGYNRHLSVYSVTDGTILAGGDGILYAVDAASGLERWRIRTDLMITLGTLVVDGSVLIADNQLYIVDLASGEEQWRDDRFYGNDILRQFSTPVVTGGTVFVGFGDQFYAVGNHATDVLITSVQLRGAPSNTSTPIATFRTGETIDTIWSRGTYGGMEWAEVTIGDLSGWIPADTIGTAAPPPNADDIYTPKG